MKRKHTYQGGVILVLFSFILIIPLVYIDLINEGNILLLNLYGCLGIFALLLGLYKLIKSEQRHDYLKEEKK